MNLNADETRHLRDVLRLRVGDEASVFDGLGQEYRCLVSELSKKSAILEVQQEIEPSSPESPLDITAAAAILPGEKYEITVQKAVELGVYRLQPLYTVRCEMKPGGSGRRMERWRKIAAESAKQSGRARLMASPTRSQPSRSYWTCSTYKVVSSLLMPWVVKKPLPARS